MYMLSDIDIYIDELMAELGDVYHTDDNTEHFTDEDIQAMRAATVPCLEGRSISSLNGSALLLKASKLVTMTRSENDIDDDVCASFSDQSSSNLAECMSCSDKTTTSDPDVHSPRNASRGCTATPDVEVESNFQEDNHLFEIEAIENDFDFSFDVLIEEVELKAQDQDRLLKARYKSLDLEREKHREIAKLHRKTRIIQRCTRHYLIHRNRVLRLQRLCCILANYLIASALGKWMNNIRATTRVQTIMWRFYRLTYSRRNRLETLAIKKRRNSVNHLMVLYDSGLLYFLVFNHRNGLVRYITCCLSANVYYTISNINYQQWFHTPRAWILAKIRETKTNAIPFAAISTRSHEIICQPRKTLLLKDALKAYTKLNITANRFLLKRLLMSIHHWRRFNAAVYMQRMLSWRFRRSQASLRIQKVYRGFVARTRLRDFNGTRFTYEDEDINSILYCDVTHLCFNDEDQSYREWEPCKPSVLSENMNYMQEGNDTVSEPRRNDNADSAHNVGGSNALDQKAGVTDTDKKSEIVHSYMVVENSRFMKQWCIRDEQVARVSTWFIEVNHD